MKQFPGSRPQQAAVLIQQASQAWNKAKNDMPGYRKYGCYREVEKKLKDAAKILAATRRGTAFKKASRQAEILPYELYGKIYRNGLKAAEQLLFSASEISEDRPLHQTFTCCAGCEYLHQAADLLETIAKPPFRPENKSAEDVYAAFGMTPERIRQIAEEETFRKELENFAFSKTGRVFIPLRPQQPVLELQAIA